MTDRYDLLIASMKSVSDIMLIICAFAMGTLLARWSIRFIPERWGRQAIYNGFDLWLVVAMLYIFMAAK